MTFVGKFKDYFHFISFTSKGDIQDTYFRSFAVTM